MSLANIFFKLQHEDTSVMRHLLVNREQEQVVDLVVEKLQQFVQNAPQSNSSMTFIPFYDTILPQNKRNLLSKVCMSEVIQPKVQKILQRTLNRNEMEQSTNEQKEQTDMMLIKFRPSMDSDSQLLNAVQISNLTEHLHFYRNM